jgi:hypothetical protein
LPNKLKAAVKHAGETDMSEKKNAGQIIWGTVLLLAGIGVFYRIPQVMPQIEKIEYFIPIMGFVRFSFYLMGALLIGGGAKKIYDSFSNRSK